MTEDNLSPPEWLGVIVFLTITLALSITAYVRRTPELPITSPDVVYISSPDIYVSVNGAVEYPQSVIIPKGSTIRELLDILPLTEEADISKLNPNKVLRKGQRLKIPSKKKGRAKKENSQDKQRTKRTKRTKRT